MKDHNGKETFTPKIPEHISIGFLRICFVCLAISLAIWQAYAVICALV